MGIIRFNTISFDFRKVQRAPTYLEFHEWLISLGMEAGILSVIDISDYTHRITLKFATSETSITFVDKLLPNELLYSQDGIINRIPYATLNGRNKKVMVREVPAEADLNELKKQLQKHGSIKEIQ